jgi:hypothetical protein
MSSKNKIVDAFAQAYEELVALPLPDAAMSHVRQLHRAFADLRHHDSEQAKTAEEFRATAAAATKKLTDLRREGQEALQAGKAKEARIAALEKDVRTLQTVVGRRFFPEDEAETFTRLQALTKSLDEIARQSFEECDPTHRALAALNRSTKRILDECRKYVDELSLKLLTHKTLLAAACLQHGPVTLSETLPAELYEAGSLSLTRSADGRWRFEIITKSSAATGTDPVQE